MLGVNRVEVFVVMSMSLNNTWTWIILYDYQAANRQSGLCNYAELRKHNDASSNYRPILSIIPILEHNGVSLCNVKKKTDCHSSVKSIGLSLESKLFLPIALARWAPMLTLRAIKKVVLTGR